MFTRPQFKKFQYLQLLLILPVGMALISCTTSQNEAETILHQVAETPVPVELPSTLLTPTVVATMHSFPTEEAISTAVATISATAVITTPNLVSLDLPLVTENLPDYGWFSEDSQVAFFSYIEEGITFSYNIVTQQLASTGLSQKSDEQIVEQIKAELPVDANVVEISPKFQNILYTTPISQPMRLERGAFTVPLGDELWLYKEGESFQLGAVDECFLINLSSQILWSPSETLAAVNAFAPAACAWSNWVIDLEIFSVAPIDELWDEGHSGFYVTAILPNKQLLLTAQLQDEPSAILDLQTRTLTIFSYQGDEIARYFDAPIFLDFLFWRSRDETEVLFSFVNEKEWHLVGTTEGLIRAKFVSPDQKHVLLFSGSPDYYGLSENQKTTGVWLLTFP